MSKILGQTGVSLADVYDIEGSVAGVEDLESDSVKTVHEMGQVIFSERLNLTIERLTTGALLQDTTFLIVLGSLPDTPWRVLGVNVFATNTLRISNVVVALHDSLLGRDMPIFVWNSAVDDEFLVRLRNESGSATNQVLLRPIVPNPVPTLGCGSDQRQSVNQLALQGLVSSFGAGTVTITATVQIAFPELGGISSYGLPIPGW
ncbi:MAG: hypothetical protein IIC36_15275 [Gemmatimonadetes bacterium]|nr:hypothetical protein [Gemmatimonadota bacterium]